MNYSSEKVRHRITLLVISSSQIGGDSFEYCQGDIITYVFFAHGHLIILFLAKCCKSVKIEKNEEIRMWNDNGGIIRSLNKMLITRPWTWLVLDYKKLS